MPKKRVRKDILIRESDIEASKTLDAQIRIQMSAPSMRREGTVRMGILSSVIAEYVTLGASEAHLSAMAYLIRKEIGHPYFWVYAEQEEGGTRSSAHPLDASTPEEAEALLLREPTIRMMETVGQFADMIEMLRQQK